MVSLIAIKPQLRQQYIALGEKIGFLVNRYFTELQWHDNFGFKRDTPWSWDSRSNMYSKQLDGWG